MRPIHEGASERDYTLLRAWVLGVWLLELMRKPVVDLDRLPAAGFVPAELFQRIVPENGAWLIQTGVPDAVQWGAVVLLVLALAQRRAAWAVAGAAVLVTVHQALARSFSHVFHAQLALLYALYAIVLFDVTRALLPSATARLVQSADSSEGPVGGAGETVSVWAVPFLGVLGALCLTYSFTGVFRIAHGGPALFFSDSLQRWLIDRPLLFGRGWGHELVGLPGAQIWLNVGFAVVTLFEALALFALVSRRFRVAFVVVMAAFHVSSYAFMGIAFGQNLLLLPLFFEPKRSTGGRGVGSAPGDASPALAEQDRDPEAPWRSDSTRSGAAPKQAAP